MTNPDFLLESRVSITDAIQHIGGALLELQQGYDHGQDKGIYAAKLADVCANIADTQLEQAIAKLTEARELAKRAV